MGDALMASAGLNRTSPYELQSTFLMDKKSASTPETAPVIQRFGTLLPVRLGLDEATRFKSVAALNRLLAHTMALRDLYKKSHWQTSGSTFYELHLLFDKHYGEQEQTMDALAERIQTLGGVTRALPHEVTEETRLARGPSGIESSLNQLARLVEAHEFVLEEARPFAREASAAGDEGTNDLIVSQVVRGNELQAWFIGRHMTSQSAPK
jgi:starvation-inducible DNA-binding protein